MKRIIKILLAVLIITFIVIQFILPVRAINGQVNKKSDLSQIYPMSAEVQGIFKKSCYDCHSNQTSYPWYENIQPVRYMMDQHIEEGRKELNFNEFSTYSKRKQRNKLRAVRDCLTEYTMPLPSYLLIHRNAKLTPKETTAILNWIKTVEQD